MPLKALSEAAHHQINTKPTKPRFALCRVRVRVNSESESESESERYTNQPVYTSEQLTAERAAEMIRVDP